MVKLALIASFSGLIAITTAKGGVCTQSPYARMLPLSGFPPAETFCSAKVTLGQCIVTSTASVTSTVSKTVATVTVVASTKIATIVLETSTLTSTTATITVTPTTDSTSKVTITTGTTIITVQSTTTVACTAAPQKRSEDAAKQEDVGRNFKRQPNKKKLLASLKTQPHSYISTVCSCIETPKPCITKKKTTTLVATASLTATTHVVATSKKFVTITVTVFTKTITTNSQKPVTTTISVEATSTTTMITTTSAGCAPNQPLPGCTDGVIISTGANGCSFQNNCNMIADFPGIGHVMNPATSLTDCINACSADSACGIYVFDRTAVTCTLYHTQAVKVENARSDPGVAYGLLVYHSC